MEVPLSESLYADIGLDDMSGYDDAPESDYSNAADAIHAGSLASAPPDIVYDIDAGEQPAISSGSGIAVEHAADIELAGGYSSEQAIANDEPAQYEAQAGAYDEQAQYQDDPVASDEQVQYQVHAVTNDEQFPYHEESVASDEQVQSDASTEYQEQAADSEVPARFEEPAQLEEPALSTESAVAHDAPVSYDDETVAAQIDSQHIRMTMSQTVMNTRL